MGEILPQAEGNDEYERQISGIVHEAELDRSKVEWLSKQIFSVLVAHTEDAALGMVESLEEHGDINGLEAWRRLHSEQRGTLSQRTDELRNKVLYPDRVKMMSKVGQAVTQWEKDYEELLVACKGNFKLDEHGKIGALKRMVPQDIMSSMILIHTQLKSYREARNFVMGQITELRNI